MGRLILSQINLVVNEIEGTSLTSHRWSSGRHLDHMVDLVLSAGKYAALSIAIVEIKLADFLMRRRRSLMLLATAFMVILVQLEALFPPLLGRRVLVTLVVLALTLDAFFDLNLVLDVLVERLPSLTLCIENVLVFLLLLEALLHLLHLSLHYGTARLLQSQVEIRTAHDRHIPLSGRLF